MKIHCPVSCEVCTSACKDQHNDCPGWAQNGECQSNPGHTLKTCPYSCDNTVCKGGAVCADKNATACKIWALDDQCVLNPAHMLAECAATCGVCTTVCQDKDDNCLAWAVEGECEKNPESMLTKCPAACGVCHELEDYYKIAIDGEAKDEL